MQQLPWAVGWGCLVQWQVVCQPAGSSPVALAVVPGRTFWNSCWPEQGLPFGELDAGLRRELDQKDDLDQHVGYGLCLCYKK